MGGDFRKHNTNPSWLIRDIFYICLGYFLIITLTTYIESGLLGLAGRNANEAPLIYLLNHIIYAITLILMPLLVVVRYYGGDLGEIGLTLQNLPSNLLIGVVSGLLILCVAYINDIGLEYILGKSRDNYHVQMLKMSKDPLSYFVVAFSGVVLAPCSEEVYFRGFSYTIFKKRYGKTVGLILSSLLFVGLHFDIWNALQLLIIGVGLAILFERTKSLVPGITAHAVINLYTVCHVWLS